MNSGIYEEESVPYMPWTVVINTHRIEPETRLRYVLVVMDANGSANVPKRTMPRMRRFLRLSAPISLDEESCWEGTYE
jgi:hypothetical protein